jgi:hypothetical protein
MKRRNFFKSIAIAPLAPYVPKNNPNLKEVVNQLKVLPEPKFINIPISWDVYNSLVDINYDKVI